MKKLHRHYLGMIPPSYFERALAFSVIRKEFHQVRKVPHFNSREELWQDVFSKLSSLKVCVLEFGVFEGYSIKKFASFNDNESSCFFGFDSFEGLPEDWTFTPQKKGTWSVDGAIPEITDKRISFVKGWFQNTLPGFLRSLGNPENLFVHYDADIYSATLYVMMQLDNLRTPYYAVFDEFTGHETRALYNYIQMTGAHVEFIGNTRDKDYPHQVSCKITPAKKYCV